MGLVRRTARRYSSAMAKPRKRFVCQACGSVQSRWQGQCPDCSEWNTLVEDAGAVVTAFSARHNLRSGGRAVELVGLDDEIQLTPRTRSYVKTPLVEQQIAAQARTQGIPESEVIDRVMLEPMPKRAFISLDELAGISLFLLSPAARNITGQTIVVDGGWTVR